MTELPKEWQQEAEKYSWAINDQESYLDGATAYKQAVEKETIVAESELEQFADNYVAQYLPHVDTTGHWIGFQEGYKKAMADMKFKLTTLTPTSND
jgi:hypothetical protein